MKYELVTTARFKKDLKTALKRGYDMYLMQTVTDLLIAESLCPKRTKTML